MKDIIKALELINDFCINEYGADLERYTLSDNLADISIGYTTLTDEEIPVSLVIDLYEWKLKVYFAEAWVIGDKADIVEDITLADLEEIDFSWVTSQEEYLEEHLEEIKEKYGY